MIKKDVLIVGGGPAGATCAWSLNQHGMDVLILDQHVFPRLKPCAGWITPQILQDLDFSIKDYPYSWTTFTSFQVSLRGIRFKLPTLQYAIRRVEFDSWLLNRSKVAFQKHTVKNIIQSKDGYLIDGEYFGKYLIGAGGTHCPVYRTIFQPDFPRNERELIIALEEEFEYPAPAEQCHLWFIENKLPGYAWYVPKANGYINVGVGGKAAGLKKNGESLHSHWQHLTKKLKTAGLVQEHIFKPQGYSYYLRQKNIAVRRDNALIIGDAVGLATLDMGEGIAPAVRSGLLAAQAILDEGDYSLASIPKYSLCSILRI